MRTRLKIMRMLSRSDPDEFRQAFRQTTQSQTVQANLFTVIKMTDILFTPQYSALLAELASSDVLLGDVVVNAGAHYRSTDFLKALMKERPRSGSLGDDSVSIAALASSWDEHSLNMILSQLSNAGWKTDIGGALSRAVDDGSLAGAGDADRILRRYGLTMADV